MFISVKHRVTGQKVPFKALSLFTSSERKGLFVGWERKKRREG